MSPTLSAIVLNYRSPLCTVRCVQALARQTVISQMEILIVENHSIDDSIGVIRNRLTSLPCVRILENRINGGYGHGNQLAIAQAKGKYLLIINPDNELKPDALEKMLKAMEADPSIGILAPQLVHEDGTIRNSYRSFPNLFDVIAKRTFLGKLFPGRLDHYLLSEANPQQMRPVDWVVGACLLIRTDFYRELKGFDPRFFLFFEDIDLCRRCWAAGKKVVYFPEAKATDRKRRLSEGGILSLLFTRTGRIHILSALRYFWKWGMGNEGNREIGR